jgi:hypothetical protein
MKASGGALSSSPEEMRAGRSEAEAADLIE